MIPAVISVLYDNILISEIEVTPLPTKPKPNPVKTESKVAPVEVKTQTEGKISPMPSKGERNSGFNITQKEQTLVISSVDSYRCSCNYESSVILFIFITFSSRQSVLLSFWPCKISKWSLVMVRVLLLVY